MRSNLFSASLVLAWLVSPEAMIVVNKAAGLSGVWFLLSLTLGAALAILCASQMYSPFLVKKELGSDLMLFTKIFGETASMAILLCGRMPLLLFVSTGVLVTAGYGFNEVFVYWFPNFLFAAVLLIVVVLVNVFAEPVALRFQLAFTALAITSLLVLVIMGFSTIVSGPDSFPASEKNLHPYALAIGFIAFLGFDFHKAGKNNKIVYLSVVAGLIIISTWAYIALMSIESARLAESAIAYMLVAKSIGGEPGRYIMGAVVIFGSLSYVNGLFIVFRRLCAGMVVARILPNLAKKSWAISLSLMVAIGMMMLAGVTGGENQQAQIYASMLLWLLYVGLRHGGAVYLLQKDHMRTGVAGYVPSLVVVAIFTLLVFSNPQIIYIIKFLLMVLVGAIAFSLIWTGVYKRYFLKI